MLDGISVDQLRTFIAAADEGSFSAAGRKLNRAQSVVSQTLANLEAQVGVQLFDRSNRYPQLTEPGKALLLEARAAVSGMDFFKARAKTLAEGLETELAVAVDVMFPMADLTTAVGAFQHAYPNTPLRLYVEALGAVVQPVVDGVCKLAIIGSMPLVPSSFETEKLLDVPMVTVAAPSHPLTQATDVLRQKDVQKHVQLLLTDRSSLSAGQSYGVFSPLVWKLADLGAKHAFLRAGFGWGHMPRAMVQPDLDAGDLLEIHVEMFQPVMPPLAMFAAWRKDAPPGPAGRYFISQLRKLREQSGQQPGHQPGNLLGS